MTEKIKEEGERLAQLTLLAALIATIVFAVAPPVGHAPRHLALARTSIMYD